MLSKEHLNNNSVRIRSVNFSFSLYSGTFDKGPSEKSLKTHNKFKLWNYMQNPIVEDQAVWVFIPPKNLLRSGPFVWSSHICFEQPQILVTKTLAAKVVWSCWTHSSMHARWSIVRMKHNLLELAIPLTIINLYIDNHQR